MWLVVGEENWIVGCGRRGELDWVVVGGENWIVGCGKIRGLGLWVVRSQVVERGGLQSTRELMVGSQQ